LLLVVAKSLSPLAELVMVTVAAITSSWLGIESSNSMTSTTKPVIGEAVPSRATNVLKSVLCVTEPPNKEG